MRWGAHQRPRAGAHPRELRRAMDTLAARAGATYPFGHIGAFSMAEPDGFYPDFYPVDRPISSGSLVMTELALGFGNYFAKLWGSYFVGDPTDDYRRLFDVAASVHDNLERHLRGGPPPPGRGGAPRARRAGGGGPTPPPRRGGPRPGPAAAPPRSVSVTRPVPVT
jgi:Xaa-Pro aminopeptidase